jgi:hypothetical protein
MKGRWAGAAPRIVHKFNSRAVHSDNNPHGRERIYEAMGSDVFLNVPWLINCQANDVADALDLECGILLLHQTLHQFQLPSRDSAFPEP